MCKQLLPIIHVVAWLIVAAAPTYAEVDANQVFKRFDLSRWKLTLPVAKTGSKKPVEISGEQLHRFQDPRYFFISFAEGSPLVFRAPCDGVTTKNSQYPRCEVRELHRSGKSDADWSTDSEALHTMHLRLAIGRLPDVKQHVVAAQIHDADDDLLMVRLEGTKLFVERNEFPVVMLERKYKLGTPFDLQITAGQGRLRLSYQGEERLSWKVSRDGCYFKAGCYTQSNFSKGDTADSYGDVDVDGDGDMDIVVANGRHWAQQNFLFLNQEHADSFESTEFGSAETASYGLCVEDFDSDGDFDIAVANSDGLNPIYLNQSPAR